MSVELIQISDKCNNCGASLTLEEMHYYDNEDGASECSKCVEELLENDVKKHVVYIV